MEADSSQPAGPAPPRTRHLTLALLFLIMALSVADRSLINVAIPGLKMEFHLSDSQLGFLAGLAFSLANVVFALPVALWADRTSRKLVLSLALALWSAVTVATAFCGSFAQLIVARMGLGAAEAGGASPAHSVIADLYPPSQRAFALSIYSSGQGLGGFLGMAVGATIIGATNDWRTAFLTFGVAGIVLAVVFGLTLREPVRGQSERLGVSPAAAAAPAGRASLGEVIRLCASRPSFFHVVAGNGISGMASYGVTTWMPSFLIRSHGLTITEAGLLMAPILLISGTLSLVGGGWLSSRLGKRDVRLTLIAPAAIMVIGVPIEIAALLVGPTWLCLVLFFIGNLSVGPFAGAVNSTVQGIAGVRQRTMAAALLLTIVGLISAGLGPWVNGMLSDALREAFADEALRMAMVIILTVRLWAALHIYLASRHVIADFARRPD